MWTMNLDRDSSDYPSSDDKDAAAVYLCFIVVVFLLSNIFSIL